MEKTLRQAPVAMAGLGAKTGKELRNRLRFQSHDHNDWWLKTPLCRFLSTKQTNQRTKLKICSPTTSPSRSGKIQIENKPDRGNQPVKEEEKKPELAGNKLRKENPNPTLFHYWCPNPNAGLPLLYLREQGGAGPKTSQPRAPRPMTYSLIYTIVGPPHQIGEEKRKRLSQISIYITPIFFGYASVTCYPPRALRTVVIPFSN